MRPGAAGCEPLRQDLGWRHSLANSASASSETPLPMMPMVAVPPWATA
jgi:hypothetical protein